MTEPLWTPDEARCRATRLNDFMQAMSQRHQLDLNSYEQLHQWSVEQSETFWSDFWDYAGIIGDKGDRVLEHPDRMPGARWFPRAQLNFAENLLRYRDDRSAVIFRGEDDTRIELSHAELYLQVAQLASALRREGVTAGDRVSGFMPNIPATLIGMLATASIGAIWSSSSPDFGINGGLARFGHVEPTILLTTDGYRYSGERLNSLERVQGIADQLHSVDTSVVVNLHESTLDTSALDRPVLLPAFGYSHASEIEFASLPFDHPLYVMFSSGKSSAPKCIVHRAGGTSIQHLKEHILH